MPSPWARALLNEPVPDTDEITGQVIANDPERCRKIEPILVRNAQGWLIEQSCGTCGRGIEKTPTHWRHIN